MIRLGPWNFLFPEWSGGGKIRLGDDPSQTMEFLILRRGAHWSGGGKIRLEEFLIPRRGARWSGGGKIRLGEFLIARRGAHWSGGGKIRLGEFLIPRRRGHWSGGGKIRLGTPAHWSGGGKIRLGDDPSRTMKERRSLVWRRKDPSRRCSVSDHGISYSRVKAVSGRGRKRIPKGARLVKK